MSLYGTYGEVAVGVGSWRRYGVVLVPLALAGLLPWWGTLALCLIFALGARFVKWHEARLLLGLLVVAGVILPSFFAALHQPATLGHSMTDLFWRYVLLCLAIYLNYAGITTLEAGSRRGLIWVLLSGLVAPGPWLVLALAGGALLRPGLEDRLARVRETSPAEARAVRLVWAWVAAGVIALTLLSSVLPRSAPTLSSSTPTQSGQKAQPPAPKANAPVQTQPTGGKRIQTEFRAHLPLPPLELILGAMALCFLLLLLNLLRLRPEPGERRKIRPVEVLLFAVMALNVVLVIAMSVLGDKSEQQLLPPAEAAQNAATADAAGTTITKVTLGFLDGIAVLGWLFFALMLGGVGFLIWSLFVRQAREGLATGASQTPYQASAGAEAALHRIRIAYRDAEDSLTQAGRGRTPAETPAGYAQRLGQQFPELAAPLLTLAHLYAPVRYGGQASNEHAAQAEQLAHEISRQAAALPRIPESTEAPHDEP